MCVTFNKQHLCVHTLLTVLSKKKIITVWVYFLQPWSLFLSALITSAERLQALWKVGEADATQCARTTQSLLPISLTNMQLYFMFITPSEFILATLLHFKISALALKCKRNQMYLWITVDKCPKGLSGRLVCLMRHLETVCHSDEDAWQNDGLI